MFYSSKINAFNHYWLVIALSFLFTATVAISEDRNEHAFSDPEYSEYQIELEGNDWRKDSDTSAVGWREQAKEALSESRIKYGYDPSYEDTQSRFNDQYNNLNKRFNNDNEITAPTQIQFNW